MGDIAYGTRTVKEVYRDGNVITHETVETIIKISSKKQVLDVIFDQLSRLKDQDSICFTVHANRNTRDPARITLTTEQQY